MGNGRQGKREGFVAPFRYTLLGAPCERVVGRVPCVFPSGVSELFPGDPVLDEQRRWTAAVKGGNPDLWRVTLTYPVLNRARRILFLAVGDSKAGVVRRALTEAPPVLPAGRVRPVAGTITWVLDAEAAGRL